MIHAGLHPVGDPYGAPTGRGNRSFRCPKSPNDATKPTDHDLPGEVYGRGLGMCRTPPDSGAISGLSSYLTAAVGGYAHRGLLHEIPRQVPISRGRFHLAVTEQAADHRQAPRASAPAGSADAGVPANAPSHCLREAGSRAARRPRGNPPSVRARRDTGIGRSDRSRSSRPENFRTGPDAAHRAIVVSSARKKRR